MMQKWIFQGDSLDISYTQKELGNILSYIDLISKSLGWSLDELMQKDSTDLKKRQENDETLEFDDSQEEQKSSDLTFASLKEYSEKVTKEAEAFTLLLSVITVIGANVISDSNNKVASTEVKAATTIPAYKDMIKVES